MRIYVRKLSKSGLIIYKETALQSVISDFVSILVILVLIGADIAFSILVAHSFVIDILISAMVLMYLVGNANSKKEKVETKEDVIKGLDELFEACKLTNEDIVRVLERAKEIHIRKHYEGFQYHNGLCFNLESALLEKTDVEDVCPDNIADYIPMFNKTFLECEEVKDEDFNGYWWRYDDIESRLAALDKLINYYKNAK
jgi:hypothetical protein